MADAYRARVRMVHISSPAPAMYVDMVSWWLIGGVVTAGAVLVVGGEIRASQETLAAQMRSTIRASQAALAAEQRERIDSERRAEAALATLAAERSERIDSERRGQAALAAERRERIAAEDKLRYELRSFTEADVNALSDSSYAEYVQLCKLYNVCVRGNMHRTQRDADTDVDAI